MDAIPTTKPLNILCIDGGGVRGLSSLLILRNFIDRLKLQVKSKVDPTSEVNLKPYEVFDLICGTSTGGIIALMLGRLRMSVDEAIGCYLTFSKRVFEEKSTNSHTPSRFLSWLNFSGSEDRDEDPYKYDASALEEWVKEVVSDKSAGNASASLEDPLDRTEGGCCRTFVVAVTQSYADSPAKIFRTYSTRTRPADGCKIWEAARATTAASPFFKPIMIGVPPVTYIDGAFSGANNPAQLAAAEADEIFPGRSIGCFLSLGTGVPDVVSVKGDLKKIAEACEKLLKSCEVVDNTMDKEFSKKTPEGQTNPYFRFSVDRGLGNIALDEWNRLEELSGITDAFMRFHKQEKAVDNCVKVLRAKAEEVTVRLVDAETLL